MKNITVAVPDDVYRAARIAAAEQGTSVSAVVARYLGELASGDRRSEQRSDLMRVIEEIRRRCDEALGERAPEGHDQASSG
jgi:hypothetical protein